MIGDRNSSQQKILQDRKGTFLPMVLGNDNSEREISQNICDDLSERPSIVPLREQLRGLITSQSLSLPSPRLSLSEGRDYLKM